MEMPEHITRMQDELSEVSKRISALTQFITSTNIEKLNRTQVHLLNIQLDAMSSYARVLTIRIEHDTELAEVAALVAAENAES